MMSECVLRSFVSQKTMSPTKSQRKLAAVLAGTNLLMVPLAGAAVQAVSSVVAIPADPANMPSPDPDLSLVSVSNTGGAYAFTGATANTVGTSGTNTHAVGGSGSDATAIGVLSDSLITSGSANVATVDMTLAAMVNAGDLTEFAMFEILVPSAGANIDAVTVFPLDNAFNPIGSYSLLISISDYGGSVLNTFDSTNINADINAVGVTFSLADFTTSDGLDPALTGVSALRFTDNQGAVSWDPLIIGSIAVPEPSVALLGLGGLLAICGIRRRS